MKKIAVILLALITFGILQPTAAYAGGQIDGGDIQNGSITGADIDNGTLTGADVKNGTIGNGDLANGSVSSAKLGSGSVTTRAIATGQVASDEIKDGSVSMADLDPSAVQQIVSQTPTLTVGRVTRGSFDTSPAWANLTEINGSQYLIGITVVTNEVAKVSVDGSECITVQFGSTATCQITFVGTAGDSDMLNFGDRVTQADGSRATIVSATAYAVRLQ